MCDCLLPGGDYAHTVLLLNRALGSLHSLKSLIKVLTRTRFGLMSEMTDSNTLIEAFRSEG